MRLAEVQQPKIVQTLYFAGETEVLRWADFSRGLASDADFQRDGRAILEIRPRLALFTAENQRVQERFEPIMISFQKILMGLACGFRTD